MVKILSITHDEVDDQRDKDERFRRWTNALDDFARQNLGLDWDFLDATAPSKCMECCTPIALREYFYHNRIHFGERHCLECVYLALQEHMNETPPEYMWCSPEHWLSRLEEP